MSELVDQEFNRLHVKNFVIEWYRKNGHLCPFSVWRLIRLVKIHLGVIEAREDGLKALADTYAPRVLRTFYIINIGE